MELQFHQLQLLKEAQTVTSSTYVWPAESESEESSADGQQFNYPAQLLTTFIKTGGEKIISLRNVFNQPQAIDFWTSQGSESKYDTKCLRVENMRTYPFIHLAYHPVPVLPKPKARQIHVWNILLSWHELSDTVLVRNWVIIQLLRQLSFRGSQRT